MKNVTNTEQFLREHYESNLFVHFRHFLSCNVIPSLDWVDFPEMIKEFLESITMEFKTGLLHELHFLQQSNDWGYINKFVYKHCYRNLNEEKLKLVFQWLIEGLTENLAKDKS